MRSCRWGIFVFVVSVVLTEAQQKADLPKPLRAAAQSATNDNSTRLPVKRVVLYKNGIGYFEHSALVRGSQELAIDFTTAQLNDVLKSLTVVDLGVGRISNVFRIMADRHLARCMPAMASLSSAVFISNHKSGNTLLQGGLAPERKQFQRHGRIRDPHNLEGVLLHLSS